MIKDYRRYFENIPTCPHCRTKLSCCEAPPFHIGDGLGWGSDVLYICLNDDCSLFVNGWKQIAEQYGHNSSYRYMQLPGSGEANVMMVGTSDAFKGSEIDLDVVEAQNERFQKEKQAVAALETCVEDGNLGPVLTLIVDEAAALSNRKRAISLLTSLNDLSCIDPIRNHTFRDTSLESACHMAIKQILENNYKKECPFCMEIIKAQAHICMFCKKEV
ncbi:MAG: zinc ribbon domain-containing protein [Desulfofustis sp.]|nr:zinc ribbon domain-containing protein [Desulfofustis sp.]